MSNELTVNLGFLKFKKKWIPNDKEQSAAWELYVELITRITVIDLNEEGMLREALSSIHSIFSTTRNILKKYGPKIVNKESEDYISFGHISVVILNNILRPFLSKWHPELLHYEQKRDRSISPREHEERWENNELFREELENIRLKIIEFAQLLEEVIGIDTLLDLNNLIIKG